MCCRGKRAPDAGCGAAAAIERCRARNILAVEMEAAALYAFARARQRPVLFAVHCYGRAPGVDALLTAGTASRREAGMLRRLLAAAA